MPLELTSAQVQALAPDASAATAGRKLGKATPWRGLGQSERALWGECQGSALYQTQVALVDLASKCSCPSRKFPCKHALGLLFLAAEAPASFPSASEPEWVDGWLAKRDAAQTKKEARAEAVAAKPVDEAAQAKRAARRHELVASGIEQLDAWMSDLVRQGLARVQTEGPSFWDAQARRLVDAQAPGLAARVRRLGDGVGRAGDAWVARLLDELGGLALLTHAYRRQAELAPALAADVQRLVGFTLEQAEVLAHGDLADDVWTVLGAATDDDERVRVQRAWLRGAASGRDALVLQFAVGGARFSEALVPGTRFGARLAYWPSASPQRALIAERKSAAETAPSPTGVTIAAALAQLTSALARLPWLERAPFVLADVVPIVNDDGHYALVDGARHVLPLAGERHELLLALSGGHPLVVAGEWDGYALAPLQAWSGGSTAPLAATAT